MYHIKPFISLNKVVNELSKIYLVEDEKALRDLLVSYLKDAGYQVTSFEDGLQAKNHIKDKPDLWILDIMLPGIDGYSLINEIKKFSANIPVIFMSARSAELDRVIGLEMGSDDYLPKPFLPRELVLRVNRILQKERLPKENTILKIGTCNFNRQNRTINSNDKEIQLTVKEFDILNYLVINKGLAISRTQIIDKVWGADYFGSERVVDDTIKRLRKKVPELPLSSIYGYGYILKVE